MTETEQKQFDRFLAAGYDPDVAAQLIGRGAWLETIPMSANDVADVRRYRSERDGERRAEAVPASGAVGQSDDDIDFSDIPATTESYWEGAVRGKFYRGDAVS